LAEWVRADIFVNASNVDAVYDKNPREHRNAKPYAEINITELIKIISAESMEAGKYPLLDYTAARVIQRSGIRTIVLDGRDIGNMRDAVEGKPFRGTTVVF
jgi:uridylate kinase